MRKLSLLLLSIFFLFSSLSPTQAQSKPKDNDLVLFDSVMNRLSGAIMKASKKQSIYAYNISNASTPGFRPTLTKEDQKDLDALLPDQKYDRGVLLEYVMSKMAENRIKHNSYISLQKKKFEILRMVATQGKR